AACHGVPVDQHLVAEDAPVAVGLRPDAGDVDAGVGRDNDRVSGLSRGADVEHAAIGLVESRGEIVLIELSATWPTGEQGRVGAGDAEHALNRLLHEQRAPPRRAAPAHPRDMADARTQTETLRI